ncbi:putative sugar O-methyltransferase [Mycolicibacterium vaccae]|uniref:putative sugar O-methyltransferase n=1 Tax=Mycolicibacterium vaccae TaxID=1810 RepID=UPI003CF7B922
MTLSRGSFEELAQAFPAQLNRVRTCTSPHYVRADWAARNAELERGLLPVPPADFLQHPVIRFQMFVGDHLLAEQLPYVLDRLGDPTLLAEDAVGAPPTVTVPGTSVRTSSNTVHQLYHLLRYEEATGRAVREAETVVEWGGGFGSLMRLLHRRHGDQPTCVLIDTPVFSALQWLYLSAVLGTAEVVLHDHAPVQPAPGRVNIVPIGLVEDLDVAADLFISNWSLNESTAAAQRDVVARDWFGARALLLAMHAGDRFAEVAQSHGARAVLVGSFLPGQQYLFR